MSLNSPVFSGSYTPADTAAIAAYGPGTVHNVTTYFMGSDIMNGKKVASDPFGIPYGTGVEASGIIAYLNLTVIGNGTDTIQLVLQEQDPTSGVWNTVAATTANATTLGLIKLKLKDAINPVAATTTAVSVQDKMPYIWRLGVVHSGASNFTYSIGITLYA